ncbi:MAG: pilus assembly protein, partial [Candidatus Micrarchaeota archaeon]
MPYADTDFFIALLKESDWLKTSAGKSYSEYKDDLWTSVATVIELMLLAKRLGIDAEQLIVSAA